MKFYKSISPREITDNIFTSIGKDAMLITAGDKMRFNTMTASWGGMGVLWNKNVVFTFIRPQRYTFEFAEKSDMFTLCFFDREYKDALALCGTKSGRDIDKVSACGFTPMESHGGVYFNEARLILVCKKMYGQFLDPAKFLSPEIEGYYSDKDYHKMFVGEIVEVLIRE